MPPENRLPGISLGNSEIANIDTHGFLAASPLNVADADDRARQLTSKVALALSRAESRVAETELLASKVALALSRAKANMGETDLLASELALALSRAETKQGEADLLASDLALALSRAEVNVGETNLLASELALTLSRAEAEVGKTDLLASETALASSQAEIKAGQTDLLASELALASSRAETKIGETDLLASEVALASSRAQAKVGHTNLLASEQALATSRAEAKVGHTNLLASELALATSQTKTRAGETDLLASELALASSRAETNVSQAALLASTLVIKTANLANFLLITGEVELRKSEERYRLLADTLRAANEQLLLALDRADRANRAKSRFLAGMSHELRTPLNGILGYAELLRMEGGLNPAQGKRVDAMLGAGKHLLQMITSVLDLSEIEAEHIELQSIDFDVQAVAEACLDLIRPTAEAKGLVLSFAMATGTRRELIGDPTRLRQVLLNLLGNAAKFTSQGAIELRLRSTADGSVLRIEVADTGAGVAAAQRQRLFQEFERLDTEAARTVEGAGLGLALSARLSSLMGGRIGHDDNPGGGSVFWLELPLKIPAPSFSDPKFASHGRDDQPAPEPIGALRLLVVDDVLMNRDIASSFLRAAGHEVTSADDGAEAVAMVASTDFDVVLMDVRMPQMDGLEATRRIRAIVGARGRVPIVALTAHAFTEQVEECRKAGMDSHLAKPFDMETLLAAVVGAFGAGRRRDVRPDTADALADLPADAADPFVGKQLLVLDPKLFDRTARFVTPETVASYMQTITELGESVLRGLREPDAFTGTSDELAGLAHKLAGSAGMFGFERVAAIGRSFERAVQSRAAEVPALADKLCAAVEATLQEIRNRSSSVGPLILSPAVSEPDRQLGVVRECLVLAEQSEQNDAAVLQAEPAALGK